MPYFPPSDPRELHENKFITVSATPRVGDYATLQAAIDAAVSGDTILLGAETFACDSITWKNGVIIKGVSRPKTKLTWTQTLTTAGTYTHEDFTDMQVTFESLTMTMSYVGFYSGGTTNVRGIFAGDDNSAGGAASITFNDVHFEVNTNSLDIISGTYNVFGIVSNQCSISATDSTIQVRASGDPSDGADLVIVIDAIGSANSDEHTFTRCFMTWFGGTGAGQANNRAYRQSGNTSSDVTFIFSQGAATQVTNGSVSNTNSTLGSFWYSPAQITSNQNDYLPTLYSLGLRLSTDAARTITGLARVTSLDARTLKIVNVGSFPIVLLNESTASTAVNRFAFPRPVVLTPNSGIELQYDPSSQRWRDEAAQGPVILARSGANVDIVSTAAETDVLNVTIPGNILGTNNRLRVRISFDRLNNTGSTQTYILRVRLGAAIMYEDTSFAMVASATRAAGHIDLVLSANNATNAQVVNGVASQGPAGGATTGLGNLASDEIDYHTAINGEAAIDSTADMILRVTVDHTNSSASNSWRSRYWEVVYE